MSRRKRKFPTIDLTELDNDLDNAMSDDSKAPSRPSQPGQAKRPKVISSSESGDGSRRQYKSLFEDYLPPVELADLVESFSDDPCTFVSDENCYSGQTQFANPYQATDSKAFQFIDCSKHCTDRNMIKFREKVIWYLSDHWPRDLISNPVNHVQLVISDSKNPSNYAMSTLNYRRVRDGAYDYKFSGSLNNLIDLFESRQGYTLEIEWNRHSPERSRKEITSIDPHFDIYGLFKNMKRGTLMTDGRRQEILTIVL